MEVIRFSSEVRQRRWEGCSSKILGNAGGGALGYCSHFNMVLKRLEHSGEIFSIETCASSTFKD